jgi:hypothetical protein
MIRRGLGQSVLSAFMCGVVAASVTGLPMSHAADHGSEAAHVEHDHGGHGTTLLEQDEQLLSKSFSFTALSSMPAPPIGDPVTVAVTPIHSRRLEHPGRDPPEQARPRAPPSQSR